MAECHIQNGSASYLALCLRGGALGDDRNANQNLTSGAAGDGNGGNAGNQDREWTTLFFWKASPSTKVGTVHLHVSVHGACKTVVSQFTEGSRYGRLMHCTERAGEYVIIDSSDLIRSAIYARTANPCSCLGSVRPTQRRVAD